MTRDTCNITDTLNYTASASIHVKTRLTYGADWRVVKAYYIYTVFRAPPFSWRQAF